MRKVFITSILLLVAFAVAAQDNVGIGTSAPDVSAKIDVNTSLDAATQKKGILPPMISLANTTDGAPFAGLAPLGPAHGLLVYNTNAAISGTGAGGIGFYFNSGTKAAPVWKRLATNADAWLTLGNSGTTAPAAPATYGTSAIGAAENFLGTIDAKDFVIGTTIKERMRITSAGNIGIGTATPTATALLTINPTTNAVRSGIDMTLTNAAAAATGINITTANSNVNGITVTHSAGAAATYYGVGGKLTSGTALASGYLGYHTGTGNTAANYFAGYFQGKTAVTSDNSPTSVSDLEVQNTTAGISPVTFSMRPTVEANTSGTGIAQLNFGDSRTTNTQAQIQVFRDATATAGAGSTDLPTAMTFSTNADGSSALTERVRITNAGNVGINLNNPDDKLDVVGNGQVNGYFKVGNPTIPTGVNTTFTIYNINFGINNWWNLILSTVGTGCSLNGWSLAAGSINYSGAASRRNASLMSPFIWIPGIYASTLVANLTHSEAFTDINWDGTLLEYSTDGGATFTTINGFSANGYNGTAVGGTSNFLFAGACQNEGLSKWTNTVGLRTSTTTAITTGITASKWVQFRIRASEDNTLGNVGVECSLTNFKLTMFGSSIHPNIFVAGSIYAEGHIFAQSNSQIGDVAEYFPLEGSAEPGMLIAMNDKGQSLNRISSGKMDPYVIGVYSKNPSVLLNSPSKGIPVALSGRADVKITNENGVIKAGDYLTASSTPGYAMRANEPCFIIGRALQNAGGDVILAMIQPGWYNPIKISESLNTGSSTFNTGKNQLKVFDNSIKPASRIFISFKGNPGSASWIEEVGAGFFTVSLDKFAAKDIPFDYLVNNPVVIDNSEKNNTAVTKEEIKSVPSVVLLDEKDAWAILKADNSIERTNISRTMPAPPSDPDKFWTWDPINGYKEFKDTGGSPSVTDPAGNPGK